MTFDVNHIGMQRGIYIARVDELINTPNTYNVMRPYKLEVVTYDVRLRAPYGDKLGLLDLGTLHTLEHCLSIALRDAAELYGITVLYEGAMACQTGLYFLFTSSHTDRLHDASIVGDIISKAVDYIKDMEDVPAKEKARCGNVYTLKTIRQIAPDLKVLKAIAERLIATEKFDAYKYLEE